jgi:hypothetical protein
MLRVIQWATGVVGQHAIDLPMIIGRHSIAID